MDSVGTRTYEGSWIDRETLAYRLKQRVSYRKNYETIADNFCLPMTEPPTKDGDHFLYTYMRWQHNHSDMPWVMVMPYDNLWNYFFDEYLRYLPALALGLIWKCTDHPLGWDITITNGDAVWVRYEIRRVDSCI